MKTLQITITALLAIPLALGLPLDVLHAAPQYSITDLGTLGGAYSNSAALNEAGQVAGYSHLPANAALHPFIWQEGAALQDLGTLGGTHALASGINNAGKVVGNSRIAGDATSHGFVWTLGAMQGLSTLGGTLSRAMAINDNGVITGVATVTGDVAEHGVVWFSPTVALPIDLGTLGGGNSQGNDINFNGQIAGYSQTASQVAHATLWSPPYTTPTSVQDLGTLGGSYSEANAVNAFGHVTGVASNANDVQMRGFVWQAGQGMVDLGALTATSTHTAGIDINANDDVVGYSTTAGGAAKRAIIRKAGVPIADLNGMILPNTGWVLSEAHAINDAGQVVGIGTLTKVDTVNNLNVVEHHAFLLSPDRVKPTITCPATVTTTGAQPTGIGVAVALDNLDPAPTVTNNRPATFPNGDTTVIWTATDANSNTATCSQLVRIGGDTTPPVVRVTVSPVAPAVSGWYLTSPSIAWSVSDPESTVTKSGCIDLLSVSDTVSSQFSCTASSAGGSTGPVSAIVKVDTVAPAISPSQAITRNASSAAGAVVNYTLPTASDLTSGVAGAVSCTPASGSTFGLGNTTVNCSVSDNAGNSATSSFVVTVADQTAPVLANVPANITVTANSPNGIAVNYVLPTATDNVDVNPSVNCSSASGSIFAVGTTTVTCSASDVAGNTNSVSFVVTVVAVVTDQTPPVFTSCPATVTLTQGQPLPLLTATDNASTPVVTRLPAGTLPLGLTTVAWTATDGVGLTATCIQQVTVNATVTETISVNSNKTQCKRINATSGEWLVQGTSSITTSNRIQLYRSPTVPADLASNTLGASVSVSTNGGGWQFQARPGPACASPISLRSTAGTVKENIAVTVQ
jgi:probable HAF family extracellular repeat protein